MSTGCARKWRCTRPTAVCKLDLDDRVPHHPTFSVNRLGRFRESEIPRHIFEWVAAACTVAGQTERAAVAVLTGSRPQRPIPKRVQFGYGLNYLIDVKHTIIIDVEVTPARTYDEVASTTTMIEPTEQRLDLRPDWLTAATAYGTGKMLAWLLGKSIPPHPHVGKISIVWRHVLPWRIHLRR